MLGFFARLEPARAHHPTSALERRADETSARTRTVGSRFESARFLRRDPVSVLVPRRALYAPHVHGPLLGARRQELRPRVGVVHRRLQTEAQRPNVGADDASAKGPELRAVREAVHADDGTFRGRRGEHGAVAGQRAGCDGVLTYFAKDAARWLNE